MCDEPVQTYVRTEGEWRHFQEYLILQHSEPALEGVEFRGAEEARATPEVLEAIAEAEAVVIGPSNPIASIGPMLAVPGMREALADTRCAGRRRQPARRRPLAEGPDRSVSCPGPATRSTTAASRRATPASLTGMVVDRGYAERAGLDDGHRAAADRHPDAGRRGARAARERGDRVRLVARRIGRRDACRPRSFPSRASQARSSASATAFGGPEREVLAAAMVEDVLDELARAELGPLVVVSRGAASARERGRCGRGDRRRRRGENGQSAAALPGTRAGASSSGASGALLVPGDCPLIDARELPDADRPRGSRSTSRSCPTVTAPARTRWRSPSAARSSRSSGPGRARATSSRRRRGLASTRSCGCRRWSWTSTRREDASRAARRALARVSHHARRARARRSPASAA